MIFPGERTLQRPGNIADTTDGPKNEWLRRLGLALSANGRAERDKPAVHILDNLFGPDVDNYSKAMSRTTLRQSLLTNNIANVNTPGYKRQDVSFNMTLEGAQKKFGTLPDDDAVITDPSSIRTDGNNVDMETEVEGLTQTQLRYEALTQMTAGYFSDLKTVIRGQ